MGLLFFHVYFFHFLDSFSNHYRVFVPSHLILLQSFQSVMLCLMLLLLTRPVSTSVRSNGFSALERDDDASLSAPRFKEIQRRSSQIHVRTNTLFCCCYARHMLCTMIRVCDKYVLILSLSLYKQNISRFETRKTTSKFTHSHTVDHVW